MRIAATFAFVVGLAAADQAAACFVPRTPAEQAHLLLEYAGPFEAIVEVRVTAVAQTVEGGWRATGRQLQTLAGPAEPAEFEFGETELVISSCGRMFAPATPGQTWVLYLKAGEARTPRVFLPSALAAELAGDLEFVGHDVPRARRRPGLVEGLTPPQLTPPR